MGFEDRHYYRSDEYSTSGRFSPYGQRFGSTMIDRIIIVNVVVWVLDMFPGTWMTQFFALDTGLFFDHFKIYTLLTAGFVHASLTTAGTTGITHIGFNMFTLWMLGRRIEASLGPREFLRFYLVAIVFANAAWLLITDLTTSRPSMVVGASGGVSAVVILFALRFPHQKLSLFGVLEMPAWVLGLLLVGGDILRALSLEASGIAWAAHLGGAGFAAIYHFQGIHFGSILSPIGDWFTRFRGANRGLRVHRPTNDDFDKLAEKADRVLDKLHREGESSLTNSERKVLENYSRKVRKRRPPSEKTP